ncbi:MAG: DUF454 domain-containing protein [Planctomycetaceae bacterium]|nr:MAG: DUF454 domain-containing protein [Planctomycetaceae bacterium]
MSSKHFSQSVGRMLYVCGGWIFVGLAIFGTIIPLLPSTPFLLLASWCFFRGSPRVHAWLHRFKWLSPTLDDWEQHHGIRKKTKRRAVILILLAVTGSLLLGSLESWMQYVIIAFVSVGLWVLWRVPTLSNDAPRTQPILSPDDDASSIRSFLGRDRCDPPKSRE